MDNENNIIEIADYVEIPERDTGDFVDGDSAEGNLEIEATEDVEDDETSIPGALLAYKFKLYATAAAFAIATVAASWHLKTWSPLVFLAASLYFIYQGISIKRRFQEGKIREVAVLCTGVKPSSLRDKIAVTFRTVEDEENGYQQEYFKFQNLPKRKAGDFMVGFPYLIYFDIDNHQALLGYTEI